MEFFDGHDLGTRTHPSGVGRKEIIWEETAHPNRQTEWGDMMGVFELFSLEWLNYFKEQGPSVSDISFLSIPRSTMFFSDSVSCQHRCARQRGAGT